MRLVGSNKMMTTQYSSHFVQLLATSALVTGWIFTSGINADAAGSRDRSSPRNVLLIITDDQNDYLAEASGVDVHTPFLDKLGTEAITFSRAYCASPVCGPSRAALFSGLYPHHTGAYLNGSDPWRKSSQLIAAETLPELFRRSGYHTWGMGKLFHAKLTEDRAPKQWDNKAQANGGFAPFGDKEHQFAGKFFSVQEWDGPDMDFPDVKSANAAIRFLTSYEGDRPFLMTFGLWRPHNPWTAPRRFFDLYEPSKIAFPPPGFRDDDLADVPQGGRFLSEIYAPRWRGFGANNPDAWRRIMHGYLACSSFADWNIGRVIKALDQSKFASDTIVIVTSDNGYHLGEKHHYGKSTLWEKSAKVPLFVRLPDQHHSGKTSDASVGLIDLYPTLIGQCELDSPPQKLDGRDFSPLLLNPDTAWKHPVITTYGEGRFSVRSGRWRYIRYSSGEEELYDHNFDPHEFTNLAGESEHTQTLERLRSLLPEEWQPSLGGRNG